jgi:hypothetical protein
MKAKGLVVENPVRAKIRRKLTVDRREIQMMCSKALATVWLRGK